MLFRGMADCGLFAFVTRLPNNVKQLLHNFERLHRAQAIIKDEITVEALVVEAAQPIQSSVDAPLLVDKVSASCVKSNNLTTT